MVAKWTGLCSKDFHEYPEAIFATLSEGGHECFPYIDDSFVVADGEAECREALMEHCEWFDDLGFVVHKRKSELVPKKQIVFLGFWLDSETMTVALTEEKRDGFRKVASDLLGKQETKIREVARLVGLMVAYAPATEYGGAHIKRLEM